MILGKRPVARDVFYGMLPELRGRAFAVSGVEGAHVLQRIRDEIATLARGHQAGPGPNGEDGGAATWDTVKKEVVKNLEPYLGDGAERRATLLIRTHGFQAFNASNWRVAQEDADTTHLQYLATEDDKVRDSHLALNGIVLPKDDPFWDTHMPPWEWGCRCRVRPMNPDLVNMEREKDAQRNPEDRNVVSGTVLEQLRNGTLLREGRRFDVTPPADSGRDQGGPSKAYQWHPDDMRLNIGEIAQRYDPEVWTLFEHWARKTMVGEGTTLWNWLSSQPRKLGRIERQRIEAATLRKAADNQWD